MKCPVHPQRPSVAACARCGRPVCDLCLGTLDGEDLCPAHWESAQRRMHRVAYGVPPMAVAVSIGEVLLAVWAVIGAVAPWLPWYRVVETPPEGFRRTVDVAGWEAGGIGGVASLVLLVAGVLIGGLVAARLLRPSLLAPQPAGTAAVPLGVAALVLLAVRIALRRTGIYTGLYLAVAAAGIEVFLGMRTRKQAVE